MVIAVGDEVLSGHTQDTNSRFIAQQLFAAGYPLRRIEVVGDRIPDIAQAVRTALGDPTVSRIIVSGGIGPTPDDLTFAAVAAALDRPLEENQEALAAIRARVEHLHTRGWLATAEVSEGNHRCAMVPAGGLVLRNPRGMAPPMAYPLGEDRWLFILPGVPRELTAVVAEELVPRFFTGGTVPAVLEVTYQGVPEAELYGPLRSVAESFPDVSVGSYPQAEARRVVVRLTGTRPDHVQAAALRMTQLHPGGEPMEPAGEGGAPEPGGSGVWG